MSQTTGTNLEESRAPVIVDGVRTPFMRSNKAFLDLAAHELGRLALAGLIAKTGLDPKEVQHVTMGCVIHDPATSNVARESLLGAGLPSEVPANTVSLACISSNVAATSLSDMIRLGRIQTAICGGTDTCSDPPIRLSRNLRRTLVQLQKVKGPMDMVKHYKLLKDLRLKDLAPDVPKVVEFSNGKSMGQGAEILAQRTGITREEADVYAARSHRLAVKSHADQFFQDDIVPVHLPPAFKGLIQDDGPREDATLERLATLKPAFDREFGVNTAGSSSFLTDGASAVLMMSQARAQELGYVGKAIVRDYVYRAGDALYEMLSGPALTIPVLLLQNNLKVEDIAVWEIHEAFAAQVVANLKLIRNKEFLRRRLGIDQVFGEIPIDRVNTHGGSLSIGHPFGATGGRLLWTAAKRLWKEGGRYAVVSGCAAGGHGSAILLENPNA